MTLATETPTAAPTNKWHIGLWAAQIALAALYGMAAYMKLVMSPEALIQMGLLWVDGGWMWLARTIGFFELLGVIGLILPAATRIKPEFTVYAAAGLTAVQALAIPFHMIRGEFEALPFNFIYLALAVLVLWGRSKKSPIQERD